MLGDLGLDRLFAGEGDDMLDGGEGNDGLFGEAGNDTIFGGLGTDNFFGGSGQDMLVGGEGNDTINAGSGFDTLIGGEGDDLLFGRFNADRFVFEDNHGNDTIGDFAAGNQFEMIDFSQLDNLDNLSDVFGAVTEQGNDILIRTSSNSSILLVNVSMDDLDITDFVF